MQNMYNYSKEMFTGTAKPIRVIGDPETSVRISGVLLYINGCCKQCYVTYTGLSKKMDWIWNRYNLKSTGRIYTFGVLKCSEEFKVLDLP